MILVNTNMDFLPLDDGGMLVFDPDTGDTHFLDDVGHEIINTIDKSIRYDDLLYKLMAVYKADRNEIEKDLESFLEEIADKHIIMRERDD